MRPEKQIVRVLQVEIKLRNIRKIAYIYLHRSEKIHLKQQEVEKLT